MLNGPDTLGRDCRADAPRPPIAGTFTNCALNALLAEHAPHSVYVAEAWDASTNTLPDLSGNERHADLMVVPSTDRQRQG